MKNLLTALFLTVAITCFAGQNPVLQNPYTTNNQAAADAHVTAIAGNGGLSNNTYTTSSQTVADNYVKNLVGTLTNYVLTTNTLAALAQPLPVNISGSAATANVATNIANQHWFNVKSYGALGDGTNDDTAAFTNALNAATAAGGGTVYFPATATNQGYKIQGQVVIPNDGVLYANHNPTGYTFRQQPIRITGDGADILDNTRGGAGRPLNGGSTLFLNATNVLAKIVTLGTGTLEFDHLNLVDGSDGNTDFIFDNNTALNAHDLAVYGQRPNTWSQDVFVLGSTNATIVASTNSTGCFQGYGTTIHNCYADWIRRFAYLRTAADSVWVVDNSVWDNSGGSCAIELLGNVALSISGNQIRGNLIEITGYTNAIKGTFASQNDFNGNTFWDGGPNYLSDYLMSTNSNYNIIMGAQGGDPLHLIDIGTGNLFIFPDTNNLVAKAVIPIPLILNFTPGQPLIIQNVQEGYNLNPIDQWVYSPSYGLYLNQFVAGGNVSWGFGMTNNAIGYPNTLWMYGTGFVGIGTNAPSQQLEVNGNAKIDGTVTATNFVGNGSGMSNITSLSTVTGIHYVSSLTFSNILTGYMLGTNALNQPVMWAVSTNIITY